MKARVIAYYLPQYHPIPENDRYWGKGFTEWRNVAKAKPQFKGHKQPHIPSDLGFYDLRLPQIREEQAKLAKEAGIEGFCYWHYWFGNGKELLEMPFNEVVNSGTPDFPFCLGWANHDWTSKTWEKGSSFSKDPMIAKQLYPGDEDYKLHFTTYLKAFKDSRYIKVDGKLLFVVFRPLDIPDPKHFIEYWNSLAIENGLKGFYFVGIESNFGVKTGSGDKSSISLNQHEVTNKLYSAIFDAGFDGINSRGLNLAHVRYSSFFRYYFLKFISKYLKINPTQRYEYGKVSKLMFAEEDKQECVYPTIVPNWDRTPRAGNKAIVWYNSTPEDFKAHVRKAFECIRDRSDEHKILFLMSWNEWGEGNYMEPDIEFGHGYIQALHDVLEEK